MKQMNWKADLADYIKNPDFVSYSAFQEKRPVRVDCSLGTNPLDNIYPGASVSLNTGQTVHELDLNAYSLYPGGGVHGHQTLPDLISARWPGVKRRELLFSAGAHAALVSLGRVLGGSKCKIQGYLPTYLPGVSEFVSVGASFNPIRLAAPDYKIEADRLIAGLRPDSTIFYLDNPNNPTGSCLSLGDLEKLAQACLDKGIIFLVDEVYGDFIEDSASVLNLDYPNIVCARSFSKGCGIAALRVGYLVVKDPELYKISWDMGIPFACSGLAADVAALLLPGLDLPAIRREVKALKEKITGFILAYPGFAIAPSHASTPIIFLSWNKPGSLYDALMDVGIMSEPGRFFAQPDSSVRLRLPSAAQFELFSALWEKAFGRGA